MEHAVGAVELLDPLLGVVAVATALGGGPVEVVPPVEDSPHALCAWLRAWSAAWVSVSTAC